jgi:hypothetical protein
MCISAILWTGFREYIYGTTIDRLVEMKWQQILLSSEEVVRRGWPLDTGIMVLGKVGTNVTDPFFSWQYQPHEPCPKGCVRAASECISTCQNVSEMETILPELG